MRELLKKLRKYEIRIRKAINTQMQGDFHSVFKGSGLEFDDVRSYQYGDDVRTIDWIVTAKGHGTYVKTFKEEKEQLVYILLDVSASQDIGKEGTKKIEIAKEITGLMTLSAIKESSQVGLIAFTDQKEKYIKPDKGLKHAYNLITSTFELKPKSLKTDLNKAIIYAEGIIKKRSVIILISDFIDDNFYTNLRGLSRKHDLIIIHLSDRKEGKFPRLGIIPVFDKESGKNIWLNTSAPSFRRNLNDKFNTTKSNLEELCKKNKISYIHVKTNVDYVPLLIKLFKIRNKKVA